jgi:ferredoxin--NADP+ reductase
MSSPTEKYTAETVTWVQTWVQDKLFSFRTTRFTGLRFTPGQFLRLGVRRLSAGKPDEIAWRAYSVVSPDYADYLEFYSIVIPDGEFTSELKRLQPGDTLFVEKQPYGFLTTARFEGGNELWLLSSGTGLAPFLSILGDPQVWQQYERIVLVHCVRDARELTYTREIAHFTQEELLREVCKFHDNHLTYIPIVTREPVADMLHQRIPALIRSGELETRAGLQLDHERSRIMICGNPEMVDDVRQALGERGYRTSRRSQPGHIAVENYW